MEPTRVLLIEDDIEQAGLISKILAKTGDDFEINWVPLLSLGLDRLEKGGIDLVILDLGLPDSEGLETFIQTHKKVPEVPIVVLTGLADERLGLAAIRLGAQDYLIKGSIDFMVTGPDNPLCHGAPAVPGNPAGRAPEAVRGVGHPAGGGLSEDPGL